MVIFFFFFFHPSRKVKVVVVNAGHWWTSLKRTWNSVLLKNGRLTKKMKMLQMIMKIGRRKSLKLQPPGNSSLHLMIVLSHCNSQTLLLVQQKINSCTSFISVTSVTVHPWAEFFVFSGMFSALGHLSIIGFLLLTLIYFKYRLNEIINKNVF